MAKLTKRQAEEELKKRAKMVNEEDVKNILDKKQEIEDKFTSNGPLGKYIEDVKLLFSIIADYVKGNYKKIPFWSIASIVAALAYVLSPVDLIPDFIPGIGLVDDALVVAICLKMIEQDLQNYKVWKIKLIESKA